MAGSVSGGSDLFGVWLFVNNCALYGYKTERLWKNNLNSPLQLFLGEVQWLQKMTSRRHTHSATLPGEQTSSYKPEESAYLESTIGVTAAAASMDSRDKVGYCS